MHTGTTHTELENCGLWWNGPVWLLDDQANWPKMDVGRRPSQQQETKAVKQVTDEKANLTYLSYQSKSQ